jgi:hypothetical protein
MPWDEANAQTELINELTLLSECIRGLLSTNGLMLAPRYELPSHHLAQALSCLQDAESAIGFVPSING